MGDENSRFIKSGEPASCPVIYDRGKNHRHWDGNCHRAKRDGGRIDNGVKKLVVLKKLPEIFKTDKGLVPRQ